MSGVRMLYFLKVWWKFIQIHQSYIIIWLELYQNCVCFNTLILHMSRFYTKTSIQLFYQYKRQFMFFKVLYKIQPLTVPWHWLRTRRALMYGVTMFQWEPVGHWCHRLWTALEPFCFSTEHLQNSLTHFWLLSVLKPNHITQTKSKSTCLFTQIWKIQHSSKTKFISKIDVNLIGLWMMFSYCVHNLCTQFSLILMYMYVLTACIFHYMTTHFMWSNACIHSCMLNPRLYQASIKYPYL